MRLGAFALAMAFSLSWAFGSLTVAGISLSLVFAFAVSLWASWALFIPEALCISFAASLSLEPALIPAILAASFVAGLLWKYSVSLASFAALAVSVSFSVFALGPSALRRGAYRGVRGVRAVREVRDTSASVAELRGKLCSGGRKRGQT